MDTLPGGEDLARKISALISSPDGMDRIREAMDSFGISQPEKSAVPAAPTTSTAPAASPDLLAALSGLAGDTGGMGTLLPLLKNMGKDDENTALLRALRPYLHGDREKRLDDAIKMMQFLKIVPLLQERGLF